MINNQFKKFLMIYFPVFIGCSIWYYFDKTKAWLGYILAAVTVVALVYFATKLLKK